jgi:hypothetical protein
VHEHEHEHEHEHGGRVFLAVGVTAHILGSSNCAIRSPGRRLDPWNTAGLEQNVCRRSRSLLRDRARLGRGSTATADVPRQLGAAAIDDVERASSFLSRMCR